MTIPTQHNCPHTGDGWCLECVGHLQAEVSHQRRCRGELAEAIQDEREAFSVLEEQFKAACERCESWKRTVQQQSAELIRLKRAAARIAGVAQAMADGGLLRQEIAAAGDRRDWDECDRLEGQRMNKPTRNLEHYHPQESLNRYPLELCPDGHICLWCPKGETKVTIAYLYADNEGDFDFRFVGDRPLDSRVDWAHFRECVEQGFRMMRRQQR